MAQHTTQLAKYTLVNDGQTEWYADTQELVTALVAVGYTYEGRYRGYYTVAEPEHDADEDGPDGGDPYSKLCSLVSAVDDAVVLRDESEMVEQLTWQPASVGKHRLRVSRDLGFAVYGATP